jgi:hypothetical protein
LALLGWALSGMNELLVERQNLTEVFECALSRPRSFWV